MTIRVTLPDDGWADLKSVDELTGADQDVYFDAYDEIMASKPQPEPRPDPDNPAQMLEPPRPRFTNADARVLRDRLLGAVITGWSLDEPLPFSTDLRRRLPVLVCNALFNAVRPLDDALSGATEDEAPKPPERSPGTGGSSGSSPESTPSLLPAPPAVPSGTL